MQEWFPCPTNKLSSAALIFSNLYWTDLLFRIVQNVLQHSCV